MLKEFEVNGIKLPKLFIASTNKDVALARENGLPYIVWRGSDIDLLKLLLRPLLEKKFPRIEWDLILGKKPNYKTNIYVHRSGNSKPVDAKSSNDLNAVKDKSAHDTVEAEYDADKVDRPDYSTRTTDTSGNDRWFDNRGDDADVVYEMLSIDKYISDKNTSVDLEVLNQLGFLPQFMGDIADCIKVNLSNRMYWTEGYNKKLGVPVGNFSSSGILKNLIILDVSSSIPDGISATMISLIDTMRSQANADLIITSSKSGFYSQNDKLPEPQAIRDLYGYGNESEQFVDILHNYIQGHEWGHVISFGDNDRPAKVWDLPDTKVHQVHHYHTGLCWSSHDMRTGYARWCVEAGCCSEEEEVFDTSWCKIVKD